MKYVPSIVLCILSIIIIFLSCSKNESFTQDKWLSYSWNDRQYLVTDLLDDYTIEGMSKSEIVSLLGNETSEDPAMTGFSIKYATKDNLVYAFGEKHGSKGYNISLIISFDENDIAVDCQLVTYQQ